MQNLLRTFLCIFVVLCFAFNTSYSQDNAQQKYSQVRIYATKQIDFQRIQNAGLNFDGGIHKPGKYFETWLSADEINMLKSSGVPFDITIDDWQSYYDRLSKMPAAINNVIPRDDYIVTSHSICGTMGGHLKVAEMITKLDSLRIQYPTLVSVKWSIGNTYENRPMWTVRITKNPDAPTGRPEVYYNGVTHAREPLGMENVFYFVYWLLENYNTDPIAKYILENREIYWTPIVNVDGYYYNETTSPTGGGQWRKNRQPYGGSTGTDLNRNYGTYNFWNSTNNGSSTSASSDTYRGPYPFSAPETQNMKNFENSRNIRASLGFHTYGNYFIKPYAWCDPTPTPDGAIFDEIGAEVTAVNHFLYGTPYQTVNYYVRGSSTDWVYSTDSTGHSIHDIDFTPEVGVIGFWPPQANILPEAQTCTFMDIHMALIAGPYPALKNFTFNKSVYAQNETGNVKVVYRNKGLMAASNIKVEFTPLNTTYITIPTQLYTKASLASRTSDSVTFNFTVSGTCPNNYAIPTRIRIKQNDSLIVFTQNVMILVGNGITTFADSAENGTTNWTMGSNWSIITTNYHSPTHTFFNTPGNNANTSMSLNFPLNLSTYNVAYLEWWQRYDAENGFDFCIVEVSSNNGTTWQQVSSYTGTNLTWTKQSFDISTMVNHSGNFRIRYRFTSDANTLGTGWWVDDIKITNFNGGVTGIEETNNGLIPLKYSLEQNFPNPFNPATQINYAVAKLGFVKISVFDILGREINVLVNEVKSPGFYSTEFNAAQFSSGIYFYRMESNGFVDTKKMTLIK